MYLLAVNLSMTDLSNTPSTAPDHDSSAAASAPKITQPQLTKDVSVPEQSGKYL